MVTVMDSWFWTSKNIKYEVTLSKTVSATTPDDCIEKLEFNWIWIPNKFGIGKITDCYCCSDLRFVWKLAVIFGRKGKVDDEVTLLEMITFKLESLKFEQYFIMQDSDHPFKHVRKFFWKIIISYPWYAPIHVQI